MPFELFHKFRQRLGAATKRRQLERELNDEVAFHLAMREQKNRAAGMDTDEARYTARRQFGNVTGVKERSLTLWRWTAIEALWQDLRYGARSLRKSPGFTMVAVLTLALGIGAPTAIFSVIDSVMLQPLPFTEPAQLVSILSTKNGATLDGPSALDARDYAQNNHSFQKMVVYDHWRKNVNLGIAGSEPEQMIVGLVPAAYFEILDVRPLMGRLFTEDENHYGKHYVAEPVCERPGDSRQEDSHQRGIVHNCSGDPGCDSGLDGKPAANPSLGSVRDRGNGLVRILARRAR
jgi:macrolide transport system ATP-binding/permease protein